MIIITVVGMIMVNKKKVAAVKVLDGGDYSDYSTIEAMYVQVAGSKVIPCTEGSHNLILYIYNTLLTLCGLYSMNILYILPCLGQLKVYNKRFVQK